MLLLCVIYLGLVSKGMSNRSRGILFGSIPTIYSQETMEGVRHQDLTSLWAASRLCVNEHLPWVMHGLQSIEHHPAGSTPQLVDSAKETTDLPASGLGANSPSHLSPSPPAPENLIKIKQGYGVPAPGVFLGMTKGPVQSV